MTSSLLTFRVQSVKIRSFQESLVDGDLSKQNTRYGVSYGFKDGPGTKEKGERGGWLEDLKETLRLKEKELVSLTQSREIKDERLNSSV